MTDRRLERDQQIQSARRKRELRISGWAKAMRLKFVKPAPEQVDRSEQRWEDIRREI